MLAFQHKEKKRNDFYETHKSINVEMTEEEYDLLDLALPEGVTISEALRQIVDYYAEKERSPKLVTFWVPKERHVELQNAALKLGMHFKTYIRQLVSDFFRDSGRKPR